MKPGRRSPKPPAASGRSTARAVIALAVMGGLVMLYGWNKFFLAPKGRAKAAVQKELSASHQQEQELRQNLAELRKLANDSKAREAELARLGKLIPTDSDVAGAILALDATAKQAQVAWSSFVPSPPSNKGGGPAAISITIQVGGTFGQIFDYLGRLESLDRLVVVDSLSLGGGGGKGSGAGGIQADIKARMFSGGSASPAPATSGAAGSTTGKSGTTAAPKAGG